MAASYGLEDYFSTGVASGDFDNNGFADLLVGTGAFDEVPAGPVLLQNIGSNNNLITEKAIGTDSNRDGLGARVAVTAADLVQVQEVRAGSSFLCMDSLWLTFGLGRQESADIVVTWPFGLPKSFSISPPDEW